MLETPFASLSREEMLGMRQAVDRLALRLKDRLGRRPRPAHRGSLDLKAVVRRNLRYDGLPLEPAWRKPRRDKPDIISLCDISSSVWHASRFMLQFLYTVQERCRRVRSFVFVADLDEVTELFARHDIDHALEKALSRDAYERSDYGSVFDQFCRRHLETVDGRTTVLVIGDGRSNRLPPQLDSFQIGGGAGAARGVAEPGARGPVGQRRQHHAALPAAVHRGRGLRQPAPVERRRGGAAAGGQVTGTRNHETHEKTRKSDKKRRSVNSRRLGGCGKFVL